MLKDNGHSVSRHLWISLTFIGFLPQQIIGQTIRGELVDAQNESPIESGVMTLLTTDGDTVAMVATTADGQFSLSSPEPGTFLLQASAFGYGVRREGLFELGQGSLMEIQFRIAPRPIELPDIVISTDRPVAEHPLVRNGFVDRHRRGFGHFITPRDLQRTIYPDTESLFRHIPGVRVVSSGVSGRGRSLLGPTREQVLMRNPFEPGWCAPVVFVDGRQTNYSPAVGQDLSALVPLHEIDAVEVYTRPVQAPPEYAGPCGAIVVWTKR